MATYKSKPTPKSVTRHSSLNDLMETHVPGTTVVRSKLAEKQYFIPYCYDHRTDEWYGISNAAKSMFPTVTKMLGSRELWEVIQDENTVGRKLYSKFKNDPMVKVLYAISMSISEGKEILWNRQAKRNGNLETIRMLPVNPEESQGVNSRCGSLYRPFDRQFQLHAWLGGLSGGGVDGLGDYSDTSHLIYSAEIAEISQWYAEIIPGLVP